MQGNGRQNHLGGELRYDHGGLMTTIVVLARRSAAHAIFLYCISWLFSAKTIIPLTIVGSFEMPQRGLSGVMRTVRSFFFITVIHFRAPWGTETARSYCNVT